MTPEAIFAAYDLLSFIPRAEVVKMRQALDDARRRASISVVGSPASTPSQAAEWPADDAALAWLVDITRNCWCLWPIERSIH